jgi:hypothetical protein
MRNGSKKEKEGKDMHIGLVINYHIIYQLLVSRVVLYSKCNGIDDGSGIGFKTFGSLFRVFGLANLQICFSQNRNIPLSLYPKKSILKYNNFKIISLIFKDKAAASTARRPSPTSATTPDQQGLKHHNLREFHPADDHQSSIEQFHFGTTHSPVNGEAAAQHNYDDKGGRKWAKQAEIQ